MAAVKKTHEVKGEIAQLELAKRLDIREVLGEETLNRIRERMRDRMQQQQKALRQKRGREDGHGKKRDRDKPARKRPEHFDD